MDRVKVKLLQAKSGAYERNGVERNETAQFPDAGNYHFHPALELSLAGLAAPATGISESVVVAAGWTGNGSSSVAQPVSTKRVAIASEVALTKRFMKKYESAPARFAMLNNPAPGTTESGTPRSRPEPIFSYEGGFALTLRPIRLCAHGF